MSLIYKEEQIKANIVLGLNWLPFEGSQDSCIRETKALLSQEKGVMSYVSSLSESSDDSGRFEASVGLSYSKKTRGSISGALLLERLISETSLFNGGENLLFDQDGNPVTLAFFDIPDPSTNKVWFCCFNAGNFISTTDDLFDINDNFNEKINDSLDFYISTFGSINVVASPKAREKLFSVAGLSYNSDNLFFLEDASLSDLLEDSLIEKKSELKNITLKKPENTKTKVIVLLLFSAIIFYFILSFLGVFDDKNTPISIPNSFKMTENKPPPKTIEQILEEARIQEISWFTQDFNKQNPIDVTYKVFAFAKELPLRIGGWDVQTISYTEKNPSTVSVALNRTIIGTPVTLKDSLIPYVSLALNEDGSSATVVFNIGNSQREGDDRIDDAIALIKNTPYKTDEVIHDTHFLGLSWGLGAYKKPTRKKPIVGVPQNQSMLSQLDYNGDVLTVAGENLYQISQFMSVLDLAKTSMINSITIDLTQNFDWSINLTVYK